MREKSVPALPREEIPVEIYLPEELARYVEENVGPVSPLLEELERETRENTDRPGMLTGRMEGALLRMLVRVLEARKVVEIGTFTGYSALMMAEGLPPNGELVTCEVSEEYASIARRYFRKSPHGSKIRLALAPALDTLRGIPGGSVDFVFIDADKELYIRYYEESLRILRSGGVIVADNVLWYGQVLSPQDEQTRAIVEFNRQVKADGRVEKVMLPVRDGVYLIENAYGRSVHGTETGIAFHRDHGRSCYLVGYWVYLRQGRYSEDESGGAQVAPWQPGRRRARCSSRGRNCPEEDPGFCVRKSRKSRCLVL
jgi:caffeoyl-CoA O-methyltransferase